MAQSLLSQLELTADEAAGLPIKEGRNVVAFLLRWHAWQEALDVASQWNDGTVTTSDARVRALTELGNHADALAIMRARPNQEAATVRLLYARTLLAAGYAKDAKQIVLETLEARPDYGMSFRALGDVESAIGDLDAAERAYLQHRKVAPGSRYPSVGLAQLALKRGDRVTADAYAIETLTLESISEQPTVEQLNEIAAIFAVTGNELRLSEVKQSLRTRFAQELDLLREQIEGSLSSATKSRRKPRDERAPRSSRDRTSARVEPALPPPTPAASVDDLPLSDAERSRLNLAVKQLFGFDALLPWQPQIIAATLRGEDVLAILPTGGGKSLTYQLPTFLHLIEEPNDKRKRPITFVISPLIALMKDQVDNLPETLRRRSVALTSSMGLAEQRSALEGIVRGDYELVYAAPERLRNPEFVATLAARGVGRLVIDEAHCVSSWGHNFRPDYLHIAQAHADLDSPPILALTATAPVAVRQDIERHLFHKSPANGANARTLRAIVADSFRSNLLLAGIDCVDDAGKRANVLALAKTFEGSGLIYCRSRALCEEMAQILRDQGENADFYHAGMPNAMRSESQNRFMSGATRILCATVAFGMGIDKPDIRFILHFGLPNSLEAYYQEAGRAGRDHANAHCVLLYSKYDRTSLAALNSKDRMTIETLRGIYAVTRNLMAGRNPGIVSMSALLEQLSALDDTAVRVSLSQLEEAGMLRRAYDAPRSVELVWTRPPEDERLRQLVGAIDLQPGAPQQWDYLTLADRSGISAAELDLLCSRWGAEGKVLYRAGSRDVLITLTDMQNATTRVESVLSRFEAVQKQQVADIYAYAHTRQCRHGYLSSYLGGHKRERCQSCNNCAPGTLPSADAATPGGDEQRMIVLRAVERSTRGPATLAKMLKGDTSIDTRLHNAPGFGQLNYLSQSSIQKIVRELVKSEYLQLRDLDNGWQVVEMAQEGRSALRRGKL